MQFMDSLTAKYGKGTVQVVAQGTRHKAEERLEFTPGTRFTLLYNPLGTDFDCQKLKGY